MGANLTPKKTLLLINSAICEDTLKTMNSSCVLIFIIKGMEKVCPSYMLVDRIKTLEKSFTF